MGLGYAYAGNNSQRVLERGAVKTVSLRDFDCRRAKPEARERAYSQKPQQVCTCATVTVHLSRHFPLPNLHR